MGEVAMERKAISGRLEAAQAHPLAELLECPAETGNLLNGSILNLNFEPGTVVFRQSGACQGLYVVVSGELRRQAVRLGARFALAPVRAGDMVELAASLGNTLHTYTLTAQTASSALLLPMDALYRAFQSYPPLRMRLLEELAREVSRAYIACCVNRRPLARGRRVSDRGCKGLHSLVF